MEKFTIIYDDNTIFIGNPLKGDWKKIDETKTILKLEYILNNACVILEGYKQYNHLLECYGLGAKGIGKIFLMGRKFEETDIVVLDIKKNQIYKDTKPLYQEYGQQILDGWQKGELKEPKCYFKRVQNVQ